MRASSRTGRDTSRAFISASDHWDSTDSPENTALSQDIYRRLNAAGLIYVKAVEQFYDPVKGMFLADRCIKGECPNCHARTSTPTRARCAASSIRPLAGSIHIDTVRRQTAGKNVGSLFLQALGSQVRRISGPIARRTGQLQPQVADDEHEWLSGSGEEALGNSRSSRDAAPSLGFRSRTRRQFLLRVARRPGRLSRAQLLRYRQSRRPRRVAHVRAISRRQRHRAAAFSSARTSSTSTPCSGPRC